MKIVELEDPGMSSADLSNLLEWHPVCYPDHCDDSKGIHYERVPMYYCLLEGDLAEGTTKEDLVVATIRNWMESRFNFPVVDVKVLHGIDPAPFVVEEGGFDWVESELSTNPLDSFMNIEGNRKESFKAAQEDSNFEGSLVEIKVQLQFALIPWRMYVEAMTNTGTKPVWIAYKGEDA